jgi:hypothetical protein
MTDLKETRLRVAAHHSSKTRYMVRDSCTLLAGEPYKISDTWTGAFEGRIRVNPFESTFK